MRLLRYCPGSSFEGKIGRDICIVSTFCSLHSFSSLCSHSEAAIHYSHFANQIVLVLLFSSQSFSWPSSKQAGRRREKRLDSKGLEGAQLLLILLSLRWYHLRIRCKTKRKRSRTGRRKQGWAGVDERIRTESSHARRK